MSIKIRFLRILFRLMRWLGISRKSSLQSIKEYLEHKGVPVTRLYGYLYLIDWRSAIVHGKTVTGIRWCFNKKTPFSDNLIMKGKPNWEGESITTRDKKIIDFVYDKIWRLSMCELMSLIQSTYPYIHGEDEKILNLIKLAKKYGSEKMSN